MIDPQCIKTIKLKFAIWRDQQTKRNTRKAR